MADAHPTVIGSQIGNGDASQMCADSGTHQDLSATSSSEVDRAVGIQESGGGVLVLFLVHLGVSEPTNEAGDTIPDNLQDFSWRDFGDINFEIGVTVVSGPSIESADAGDGVESAEVGQTGIVEGTEHVNLGSSDVGFLFVVDSVFVKPVVESSFEVDVISEVSGTG